MFCNNGFDSDAFLLWPDFYGMNAITAFLMLYWAITFKRYWIQNIMLQNFNVVFVPNKTKLFHNRSFTVRLRILVCSSIENRTFKFMIEHQHDR